MTKTPQVANTRKGKKTSNWEIVLIQYYNFDKCNDFVIVILTYRGKYSEKNREHQEEDSCKQTGSKMAPRTGKRETKTEEGTSGPTTKRRRKPGNEHMKTIINACMTQNPPNIRAQIASWERELNDNIKHPDIPIEEWDSMVLDTGNTCGRHSLFRETIQQYWVMKNVAARAMTLH